MKQISKNQCLRCNGSMHCIGIESIQLGQTEVLSGTLSNIPSRALEVEIYICMTCGKVEFYAGGTEYGTDTITQMNHTNCGQDQGMKYQKCSQCGAGNK